MQGLYLSIDKCTISQTIELNINYIFFSKLRKSINYFKTKFKSCTYTPYYYFFNNNIFYPLLLPYKRYQKLVAKNEIPLYALPVI